VLIGLLPLTHTLRGFKRSWWIFLLQVGPRRAFYQRAKEARGYYIKDILLAIINSLIAHIEAGLQAEVSPERRAQLDVVSDFLEQSRVLLETKGVHPAAPAVLIGAARR
jgi:hypothetical protein